MADRPICRSTSGPTRTSAPPCARWPARSRWPAAEPVAGGPDIAAAGSRADRPRGRGAGRRRRASRRTPPIDALALDARRGGRSSSRSWPCSPSPRWPARPDSGCRASGSSSAGRPRRPRHPRAPAPSAARRCVQDPSARSAAGWASASRSSLGVLGERARFPVRIPADPTIGPPDAAWVDPARNDQVALVWPSSDRLPATQEPGVGLVLTAFRGAVDDGWFTKVLGAGTTAERVRVGGQPGYWVSGDPHFFFYEGPNGPVEDRAAGSATSCSGRTARSRTGSRRRWGATLRSPSPRPCSRAWRGVSQARLRKRCQLRGVGTGRPAPTEMPTCPGPGSSSPSASSSSRSASAVSSSTTRCCAATAPRR